MGGRVTAIFGPSGAGKTSLLDLIVGLRRARSAFIQLDGTVLTDTATGVWVPTRRRGIGYVPQDLALFPHLSVRENVCYGHRGGRPANPLFSLDHVMDALEIQPLIARRVTDLSGGEQQRVALARALLTSPRLLLLDEPLGSLDQKLKAKIIPYLARIRDEFHLPMLYVTHDRVETLALADEIVVLIHGKIVQAGPVQAVFSSPASLAAAETLAVETVQPGRIVQVAEDLLAVTVGRVTLSATMSDLPPHTDVYVCIRAEDVILAKGDYKPSSARNRLPGRIRSMLRQGPMTRIDVDCGFPLMALLTKQACEELNLANDDAVTALIKASHVHLIQRLT